MALSIMEYGDQIWLLYTINILWGRIIHYVQIKICRLIRCHCAGYFIETGVPPRCSQSLIPQLLAGVVCAVK